MRKEIMLVTLLLCAAGMALAMNATPAQATPGPVQVSQSVNYHPNRSPAVAALQTQAEDAVARGNKAEARELSRQIQAQLIEEQHAEPQPIQPIAANAPAGAKGSLSADQLIKSSAMSAISADYEQDVNGTMWAAMATTTDTLTYVYKSSDHGVTWSYVQAWW
jgi:nitric oxide reductase activation protein